MRKRINMINPNFTKSVNNFLSILGSIGWTYKWMGCSFYNLVNAKKEITGWRIKENSDEMENSNDKMFGEYQGFFYIKIDRCKFKKDDTGNWIYMKLKRQIGKKAGNEFCIAFRGKD